MLRETLAQLRAAVEANAPIDLTDEELRELAVLCATELRARMPEYAVRQGDLPESYMDAVRARQHLHTALEDTDIFEGIDTSED